MPRLNTNFRLACRNIFLTYSQCPLDKEYVLNHLHNIQYNIVRPKYIRVAHEKHQNGNSHLHCLIQFTEKTNIRSPRYFDIPHPQTSTTYHPNCEPVKSAKNVKEYISKDGDYVEFGEYVPSDRKKNNKDEVYQQAIQSTNCEEAMEIIKNGDPKTYVVQFHNIENNLNKLFKQHNPAFTPRFSRDSFVIPPGLQSWLDHFINIEDRAVSLVSHYFTFYFFYLT